MTLDETIRWFEAIYDVNSAPTSGRADFVCVMESERPTVQTGYKSILGLTTCEDNLTALSLITSLDELGFTTRIAHAGPYVFMIRKSDLPSEPPSGPTSDQPVND